MSEAARRFLLLLLAVLLLSGCGASPEASPPDTAGDTLTVTDDLGRAVTVPRAPRRVAALIGSFADIWCLAGGAETLAAAADDTWSSFALDLPPETVDLGPVKSVSLEALIAAEPELVLGSTNTEIDLELMEPLEAMGIPVLYFHVDSFEEYLHMLSVCTEITGREENYQRYGEEVRAQVERAVARQDGRAPTVLYIRAAASGGKAKGSRGNVLGEMLSALGCKNIADGDSALLENLSLEAIMAADPEYIFLIYQGADPTDARRVLEETLLSNPAWSTLRAVAEGRCYVLEHRLYNLKPNAQWGIAYERLADILYGEETE